jgi:hypothetical protein
MAQVNTQHPSTQTGFSRLLLLILAVWGISAISPVMAQEKEITIEQRDCDVTILPNGDVQVEETWKVIFRKGRFSRVMHDISTEHLTGITGWEVEASGVHYKESANEDSINYEPHTYTVREGEERTTITWYFPKTQNRTRTFTLKYILQGAVRVYPDGNDIFTWNAIEKNHGYPVIAANVTVHLPTAYEPSSLQAASYRDQEQDTAQPTIDEQTVTFTGGPFMQASRWRLRVQFPHGAVQADPPPWQTAAEHAFADATNAATVQQDQQDLTITTDGNIQVVETWDLDLNGGPFSNASLCLSHDYMTGVGEWVVSEQDTPYEQADSQQPQTFTVDVVEESDQTQTCVTWYFPVTTTGTRTFTIGYLVQGGLWIAFIGDTDMLSWDISDYARTYTINAAEATVHLPSTFATDQIHAIVSCDPEDAASDGTVVVEEDSVTYSGGPFAPDVACTFDVQFPHGSVNAAPPPWQQVEDVQIQQTQQQQQQQAFTGLLIKIAAGVVGLVLLVVLVRFWRNMPK